MKNYLVYVVSKTGKALMPTKRFGKVRRLLKSGQARVVKRKPFTIQLLYETTEHTQELIMGIDPGALIGCTVRKSNGEVVYAGEMETRSREVSENMTERRMHRRSRRGHRRNQRQRKAKKNKLVFVEKKYQIAGTTEALRCKYIKPKLVRFHNRCREKNWLTPTARHLLESHQNFIKNIKKILPISQVYLEYGQFDIHKLENPEVSGKEYQNGRKKGYVNSQEYVLCRDKHTCKLCEQSKEDLQVHHVIWESDGGSDTPENLITLCAKCHDKVHKNPQIDAKVKELFRGIKKRYVHTTLVNTIMPSFHQWLTEEFGKVFITYGYETKEKRWQLKLPKQHHIDAYLISLKEGEKPEINWDEMKVYKFQQSRRHHRQIIHAVRERNYKQANEIVAKNRNKRTGQVTESLAEFVEKNGRKVLSSLRVLPGKKVKRSNFNKFRKGDVIKYKGENYIVKGYGEMGRRLGFINQKQYVAAKDCRIVMRNTGIICL